MHIFWERGEVHNRKTISRNWKKYQHDDFRAK